MKTSAPREPRERLCGRVGQVVMLEVVTVCPDCIVSLPPKEVVDWAEAVDVLTMRIPAAMSARVSLFIHLTIPRLPSYLRTAGV